MASGLELADRYYAHACLIGQVRLPPIEQPARSPALLCCDHHRCRHRAGFATGITLDWLPSSRVWSAVAARRTRIICDLRNQGRLAAESATNSLCRCVVAIIGRSTAVAMKRHGGKKPALIRPFRLVLCGWKAIRYPDRVVTTKARHSPIGEGRGPRANPTYHHPA
jgi:hypothetical protein